MNDYNDLYMLLLILVIVAAVIVVAIRKNKKLLLLMLEIKMNKSLTFYIITLFDHLKLSKQKKRQRF